MRCCRLMKLSGGYIVLGRRVRGTRRTCRLAGRLVGRNRIFHLSISRFRSHKLGLRRVLLSAHRRVTRTRHTLTLLLKGLPFRVGHSAFRRVSTSRFPTTSNVPTRLLYGHPSIGTTRLRLLTYGTSTSTTHGAFFPSLLVKKKNKFGTFSLDG